MPLIHLRSPPAVITLSWVLGRPWVLASTSPCTCPKRDLIHENGSDRDALEGGRELGGVSKRQAVIADMAKWGSGEASGAPEFPLAIDQIGMLGVHTIMVDSCDRLVWLVQCSSVALLQHDRRSVPRVLQQISGNPIRFEGGKGLRICLGMGRTGVEALRVLQIATRAWNARNAHSGQWEWGHEKQD